MAGLLWYRSYMDSLANTNGYYPDIRAGHADRVTELTLDAPYLVRETPAGYNQLELMELVGGTVAWNQLVQNGNFTSTSGWSINGGTINGASNNELDISFSGSSFNGNQLIQAITLTNGHKHLAIADVYFPSVGNTLTLLGGASSTGKALTPTATGWYRIYNFFSATYSYWMLRNSNGGAISNVKVRNVMTVDLTQMLRSTIADYVYSLEQATAGSGIQWLKDYDLIDDNYHAYSAPALEHVKTTAHITKDADDNVLGTYPFDSGLLLRGVLKLDNGALIYDGDTYEPDGTVTRYFGIRAYQAGDESLTDAITDGTDTVYKLGAPTTDSADPYTAVQDIEEGGTEEFVTGNNVPVGNVSVYRRA